MDREDLDKQLKEHGEGMQSKTAADYGKKKILALGIALLLIGGVGGYYYGSFAPTKQPYQFTETQNNKSV